jgi:DNA gyrase subunit A
MGMRTKDEDFVDQLFIASTHSYILIFTDRGRVYWLKVHEIPEVGPQGRGKAVVNLVHLSPTEKIAAFVSVKDFTAGRYVLLATRKGIVKKTELDAFSNPRPSGIIALGVEDDDALIEAVLTSGEDEVLLGTRDGMAIHFSEQDVRPMGRAAAGVRGMKLRSGDEVVSLDTCRDDVAMLIVTDAGYGKRTQLEHFNRQNRGGQGVRGIKLTAKKGHVVAAFMVGLDDEIFVVNSVGTLIRMPVREISSQGRDATGVRVMNLGDGETVASVAPVLSGDDDTA